ncbi:helix-turn-helix transcriptional regulator [Bergeyella zoohelcum]|uniref:helix-turn-helix domain-containing protein n=1 Tax=Bergeyella zoohelcum TaxID=1015 RepID=UPI002A90FC1A|nr:helix-turn-helix transcriptional regulator [Bergeyella zoohelcum]MDY6025447.1 helix-turn-helix transcriptional regulator [Bergeyella zoohelcum]
MNSLGFNIRKIREQKGFSQEYMANVLNISQASYARMENEETKITVERLQKIAEILETSIIDFFNNDRYIINNQNYDNAYGNAYVQNLTIENKDANEKLIASYEQRISEYQERLKEKDEQISFLKTLNS